MIHAWRLLAAGIAVAVVAAWAQADEWPLLVTQGYALEREGKYLAAAESYRNAAQIGDRLQSAKALNMLGTLDVGMGRYRDAESEYGRALAAVEATLGKECTDYAVVLANMASLYAEEGQTARAEALMRRAFDTHAFASKPDDLSPAIASNALAQLLLKRGKWAEAERLLRNAMAEFARHPGSEQLTAVSLNNLAVIRQYRQRHEEARELLRQSLALLERDLGRDHQFLVRVLGNLAVSCGRSGRRDEAAEAFRRALAIARNRLEPDNPVYGWLLHDYAEFLRRSGDKATAKTLEARSREALRDSSRRNGAGLTVDVSAFQKK